MFVKRFTRSNCDRVSYLIADTASHIAAVVDPTDRAEQYCAGAADAGCQIRYVLFTRSDLVSAERLREWKILGVSTYVPSQGQVAEDGTTVRDGDVIQVGNMRLSICSVPQCIPADVALLVYDLSENDLHPMAMLAGGVVLSRPETPNAFCPSVGDDSHEQQEESQRHCESRELQIH